MSTATLASDARRNVALFTATPRKGSFQMFRRMDHATGNQVLTLKGLPVFRAGTFRDSMGIQHTWEDMHMQQMVDNFELLLSRGIMPGVPVRKGHNGFFDSGAQIMDGLIGWHTGLSVGKQENPVDHGTYSYLLADYDILDADAQTRIENGLWKSLSAEVGTWIANSEAEYWPVYRGVAYVDFPAVEGLVKFSSANGVGTKFSIMTDKEIQVGADNTQTGQQGTGAPTPPQLPPVPPQAQPGNQQQQQQQGGGTGDQQHGQQNGQPAPTNGPANNTFTFTLSTGQTTTDYAAVQADLVNLAAFKKESIEAGRRAFIQSLATGPNPKLLASNVDAAEKFALSLTDEQFVAYRQQWEGVAPNPVTGNHTGGTSNTGSQPQGHQGEGAGTQSDNLTILIDRLHAFSLSGMTPDQIKKTPSYTALKQLDASKIPAALV